MWSPLTASIPLQFDPLLEKGKGKYSKAEQEKKKRQNEWSGRANQ